MIDVTIPALITMVVWFLVGCCCGVMWKIIHDSER